MTALEIEGIVTSRKRAGTFVARKARVRKQLVALVFDRVAKNFDFPASEMIEGIRETLGDQIGLVLCDSKDSIEREAYFLNRMANETDGVICFPIADQRDGQLLEKVHAMGCPLVVVDRIPAGYRGSSVVSEDRQAILAAVEMLAEQGHRRIGFIGFHKETVSSAMDRYHAFMGAMEATLGVDAEPFVRWIGREFETNGDLMYRNVRDCLFSLVRGPEQATAVICMQDDLGLKATMASDELGIALHDELEIVTINEWPASELKRPWDLHRIVRRKRAIGIAAAELLLEQIENSSAAPRNVSIRADFIPSSPLMSRKSDFDLQDL
jgi:LacI family transcriptional regulator